jgi:ribosome biogenesis GTPase / thiamine phosphate phosphatase
VTGIDVQRGVVSSGTGGVWNVIGDDGTTHEVSLRGRLKKSDAGRRADGSLRRDTVASQRGRLKLAVGDRVRLERDERDHTWTIAEILPRTSRLARRAPGGGRGERIIAANVDQVVIVFAAAQPEPHTRMLDRFLVIAEANGLPAIIVVNKIDLVDAAATAARFADYTRVGYQVHFASVKRGDGLEDLLRALGGRISVFTGPSGVGKSSLLNAVFPGLDLRVGEISASVGKGRHTTVGAYLHPLPPPSGGAVVDTPGLREIGMWELTLERLDACFPEFRAFCGLCKFSDCTHVAEPGCAVRGALDRGEVSAARYDSYRRLREELVESRAVW